MEKHLPEEFKFTGKWRLYQQKFLDDIKIHLDDKKLNVVAAPGAGKTTLGIEIVQRLKNPALILSPSITIKNQWKQRLVQSFLPENANADWVSTSIKNIAVITSTTYQAVHSVMKTRETTEAFIEALKQYGVKTLVLDESHHLRKEWYRSLEYICKCLEASDFRVVSLTATPPYDVTGSEWNNYYSLCGPVDAEISIPELVKNGDLCPHQDLIWFSDLTEEEKNFVFDFEKNRRDFFDYINKEMDFSYAVKTSAFVADYENNTELIYDDTDFTISIISYLLSLDDMDMSAKILSEFLCIESAQIPKFNYETAEILFNGVLGKYKNYFKNVSNLKAKLKEYKLLKTSTRVDFVGETDLKKLFALNKNKLDSIVEITKLESDILKEDLREVVLLDYIGGKNAAGLNVLSVFENVFDFAKKSLNTVKAGILTGSLVVIPSEQKAALYDLLKKYEIKKENVLTTEFKENYLRVESYGSANIVPVITELFSDGGINVLIGTQALLGEGWDAPCVNTLIIASTVGSYMLSNQMRGRALRVDKRNLNKNSDIWHLVSLYRRPGLYEESCDLSIAKKRFETFEGISHFDNKIQNGLLRLGYDSNLVWNNDCKKLNEYSKQLACQRHEVVKKWKTALYPEMSSSASFMPQVYESVQTQALKLPKICYWESENFIIKFLKKTVSDICINNSLKQILEIANALLITMYMTGDIRTLYKEIKLVHTTCNNSSGNLTDVFLTVVNCTNYERNLFIKTLNELLSAPKNHRYILKKQLKKTEKYIAVSEILGTKKEKVKELERNLRPILGYLDIVFTKNPQGRKELLISRFNPMLIQQIQKCRIWI